MAIDRIRGHRLLRIREQYLRMRPLCAECERNGRLSAATQLDHVVALVNGGRDFVDALGGTCFDNAQGLCTPCHVDKTRRDLGQKVRPTIGLDGWPTKG